jgi:YcaO-like protein with predicted kinase domain
LASVHVYLDRIRSPAETVERVRPFFSALGITRVARQTDLDRVGIPCFAAIRPNSCSIATNQGKGVDDDAARASAVMEAVEYAVAEQPERAVLRASPGQMLAEGRAIWNPRRMLPIGHNWAEDAVIGWLAGERLGPGGEAVFVPADAVAMRGERPDFPAICQSTNGLASGNNGAEATFHAVCELVERDAATLWSLRSIEQKRARCVSPESFDDPIVLDFVDRFERAGLALRLFDQTTDLGIPTILAVSGPAERDFSKHFDIATGAGTHPFAARAALRAITEAAQTRVTSIAGARDDVMPGLYRIEGAGEAFDLLAATPVTRRFADPVALAGKPDSLLAALLGALAAGGITDLVSVPLGGERFGVAVVHVLSQTLEDRGPNANWRPGLRALDLLAPEP